MGVAGVAIMKEKPWPKLFYLVLLHQRSESLSFPFWDKKSFRGPD